MPLPSLRPIGKKENKMDKIYIVNGWDGDMVAFSVRALMRCFISKARTLTNMPLDI